ncbi:neuronal acetylcholine receptor subunit alpha-7-like [Physella acuta]|uniref:neuronal acetylcholine receptor subunit alpha-7-like n=1 Tax=Physella acuta TaxID=109671 RepID=UPI0027DD15E8|nr:neuronal acetylcholine receptor subunit alpha-7-like [Physella acuta]
MKLLDYDIMLLLACVTTLVISDNVTSYVETYAKLCRHVLQKDSVTHKIPPGEGSGDDDGASISLRLLVIDVLDIDQINQLMTIVVYIEMSWQLPELSWDPPAYGNIQVFHVGSSLLWTPNIVVVTGSTDSLKLKVPDDVLVLAKGYVEMTTHQYLSFRCDINFMTYPFDSQTCGFGLYPMTFPFPTLNVQYLNLSLSGVYEIKGEWTLIDHNQTTKSNENLDPFPFFSFTVRRQSTYYVVTLVFPMVLTSAIIPLVFLIPVRVGEKFSYLVAVFTSAAIFLNLISDVMPRGLSSMPYLAILLVEVLCEGLCAILATLLVINLAESEEKVNATSEKSKNDVKHVALISTSEKMTSCEGKGQPEVRGGQADGFHWCQAKVGFCCMTSRQLDHVFFFLFATGQVTFLVGLFGFTGWIRN